MDIRYDPKTRSVIMTMKVKETGNFYNALDTAIHHLSDFSYHDVRGCMPYLENFRDFLAYVVEDNDEFKEEINNA